MDNGSPEARLKPSAAAVLQQLRRAGEGGVTTGEFIRERHERFSARLEEIRRAGWTIDTVRLTQSKFKYVLREEPVGLHADALPADVSVESGGSPVARDTAAAVGMGGPGGQVPDGGGRLFAVDELTVHRGYADPEEAAA